MLEKHNLKPIDEMMEEYNLTPDNSENLDDIKYYEVYSKGNLVLYEFDNNIVDSVVSEEIVNELFPEYETKKDKGYLIEENGKFYA